MVDTQNQHDQTIIVLTPNRSASWHEVKVVVWVMVTFVMIIAIAWTFVGAWIVLPFAGLEVGLLALFMYRVNRQCHAQQVITLREQDIVIECGITCPVDVYRFNRYKTHLAITEAANPFDKVQLLLQDDEQQFTVGQFLNQHDSELARRALISAGLVPVSNLWWEHH